MDAHTPLPTNKSLFVKRGLELLKSDLSFEDSKFVDILNLYTCGSEPQILSRCYRKCLKISTRNYFVSPTKEDKDNWVELYKMYKHLQGITPFAHSEEYEKFKNPEDPIKLIVSLRKLSLECWNRLQCDNFYRQFKYEVKIKSEHLKSVLERFYARTFPRDDYDDNNIEQWFDSYSD